MRCYYQFCILLFTLIFSAPVYADVNVAVIAPRAGQFESFGNELIEGVNIAVNAINQNGGVNGQRVNLVIVDDQCDDILSLSTAQMMTLNNSKESKISLVIGPYCSNSFEEIAAVYAKANIFQIIPTTLGERLSSKNHKGVVKMLGSSESQARDFFMYYRDNFRDKIAAIVYDSNDRGVVDVAASIQTEFVANDLVGNMLSFDINNYKNSSKIAKSIVDSGARVAYILGEPNMVTDIFREIKSRNKNFIIFVNRYRVTDEYNHELGDLADDSYFISLPSLKDNPAFTEELVNMRLLGIEPEGLAVYSYSAMKLWEELVRVSGSFDYNKLVKSLENNTFSTSWGNVMFNNGSPDKSPSYSIYRLKNGMYEKVY